MINFVKDLMAFVSLGAFSMTCLIWIDLLRHIN